MARKSTGKRLRFAVFNRDHFTCQYCGAQPPDVLLVCDHVTPVCEGGETTLDNLMTACETCNQGKAHKPISAGIRPDADLLYLSTLQEVSEIRRYQSSLVAKQDAISSLINTLQDMWIEHSGLQWSPSDELIRSLLNKYSPDTVGFSIMDVAHKCGTGYLSTHRYSRKWIAYLHAVCRNRAVETNDTEDLDS